jgi:threonine/homoserine/homoserine lactone efflux protein
MFGIENFKLFVFTVLVVNLTPGASVVFVISKSLSRGIKPAIFGALGLGSGILVYAMLTAFGLSALIASNAPLFHTIKIAGALYLIFLGIRSLLNKPVAIGSASSSRGYFASWKEGTLINILNPLIILFFLSVLPQFVNSDNNNAISQLLFLGIWMALSAIFVNSSYAIVFGFFGKYLVKFPQALTYIQRGAGILLIAIGIVHLF